MIILLEFKPCDRAPKCPRVPPSAPRPGMRWVCDVCQCSLQVSGTPAATRSWLTSQLKFCINNNNTTQRSSSAAQLQHNQHSAPLLWAWLWPWRRVGCLRTSVPTPAVPQQRTIVQWKVWNCSREWHNTTASPATDLQVMFDDVKRML